MQQEYKPQDPIEEKELSHSPELRPSGSASQARHIALMPLLYLTQAFFLILMVVLSWVRRWWHHPIVGYLIALLLQAITVSIMLSLIHIFPTLVIPGLLLILATLVIALGWGAGPSVFSVLLGTALFNYFLLSPQFSWNFQDLQRVTETVIFLLVGATISLLAGHTKHARLEAEAARSRLHGLFMQAPACIAILHGKMHRFKLANPLFLQMAGGSNILGKTVQEVLPAIAGQNSVHLLDEVYRTGTPFIGTEVTLQSNSGDNSNLDHSHFNIILQPTRNAEGKVDGILLHAVEVKEQVQARKQIETLVVQLQAEQEALRESEARFRRLFEANILGIHFANIGGTITESNDAFLQMVGFTHEEVQKGHLRWNEITPVEYREADRQAIAQLQTTGVCLPFEKEYLRKDGSCVHVLVGVALLEGSEEAAIAYVLDLTERKRLEVALRRIQRETAERASELEAIFETITDQILVYDRERQIIRCNEAARRFNMLLSQPGYLSCPAQVRLEPYVIRNHQGEHVPLNQLPISRILAGEVFSSTNAEDVWVTLPDGRDVLLNVTGAPIYNDQRQIMEGVIICRDVTERRRLEQRTQDVLEGLLAMAHVIVQGDPLANASSDQASQAMAVVAQQLAQLTRRILGCKRLSIMTIEPGSEVLHPVAIVGLSAEQEQQWWAEQERQPRCLSDGPDPELSVCLRAKELLVLDMSKPPFDSQPNPYGVRTMLIAPLHISEQLVGLLFLDHGEADHTYTQQELQLTKAIAELAALVIERERLLHERAQAEANALAAQESTRLMDAFIGIAGHELRTPLTTIKGNIQLISRQVTRMLQQKSTLPAEITKQLLMIQSLLERAERQAGVQNRLVRDLVEVSRIHSDHLELRMEPGDLVSIVRQAVEEQRLMNPARSIGLTVKVPQLLVRADADRVEQVIHNYLSNALKYSGSTAPVEVCLAQEGTSGLVLVRDQGPGLTEDQQKHIWERFHRAEGVKVKSGSSVGLGLGLHISQTVIERHGGQVGVESVVGEGSTFWFTLPLADSLLEATEK